MHATQTQLNYQANSSFNPICLDNKVSYANITYTQRAQLELHSNERERAIKMRHTVVLHSVTKLHSVENNQQKKRVMRNEREKREEVEKSKS